ncbi:MAG: murein L,D-transpeptidase [Aestuariivirgaceae bacterium]|nr:murein L,D-transpeptidase [Aestuariivirgaceae bacterium]
MRSGFFKLAFAFCVALPLAGCLGGLEKAAAPLPEVARTELAAQGLELGAPVYVRIFKLEAQMEVWLGRPDGTYQLFRTYDICNYSGDLGPKIKEGDKQAPEGYYIVTSKMMNPNSKYYLSFNIGFPNKYDRANGRTGSALMVHGGCLSKGCYAITDEVIQELYILAREAFNKGQRNFPLHAYPFKLTDENLAIHKDSQWRSFWANLKVGFDMFEKTKTPPIAAVSGTKYVFHKNEAAAGGNQITGW